MQFKRRNPFSVPAGQDKSVWIAFLFSCVVSSGIGSWIGDSLIPNHGVLVGVVVIALTGIVGIVSLTAISAAVISVFQRRK